MEPNKQLILKIHDRDEVVYEGEVVSLTSFNEKGEFDVLAKHANFISLVQNKLIIVTPDNKEKEIPIKNGVIKVENNKADVYLGVGFS
ncbi:hypothetical protein IPM62_01780 [Candidatus Woesebacteria bacterium]|nr:MAG: hypothetical protein IPM62_01780 [Candidatus Woesebacteria bacterium]